MIQSTKTIRTIETHTAGEPTRIILSGLPWDLYSHSSVTSAQREFAENHDEVRKMLMKEPRGHDDMYGAVLLPPTRNQTDLGVFFLHNGGYNEACIHGTIGITTALIETGQLQRTPNIKLETPAGVFTVRPELANNRVEAVEVVNVPSFMFGTHVVEVQIGSATYTVDAKLVHAGNNFALVDITSLPISINRRSKRQIINTAKQICRDVNEEFESSSLKDTERISFVDFYEPRKGADRNTVVFGNGSIDRSPCGTGTCARMAQLYTEGELDVGETYERESIIGTEFTGYIEEARTVDDRPVIDPVVKGSAYITGSQTFYMDSKDPIDGFSLSE